MFSIFGGVTEEDLSGQEALGNELLTLVLENAIRRHWHGEIRISIRRKSASEREREILFRDSTGHGTILCAIGAQASEDA